METKRKILFYRLLMIFIFIILFGLALTFFITISISYANPNLNPNLKLVTDIIAISFFSIITLLLIVYTILFIILKFKYKRIHKFKLLAQKIENDIILDILNKKTGQKIGLSNLLTIFNDLSNIFNWYKENKEHLILLKKLENKIKNKKS